MQMCERSKSYAVPIGATTGGAADADADADAEAETEAATDAEAVTLTAALAVTVAGVVTAAEAMGSAFGAGSDRLHASKATSTIRRMRRCYLRIVKARIVLLASCVACASEFSPVGPMLLEARDNHLAATTRHRSERLALAGIVVGTGKKKIEHGAGRTGSEWSESTPASMDAEYEFVQIRDPDHPSPDVVTCYFTGGGAQAPEKGATIHVHGVFVEYAMSGGHVDAVLQRCSVEP